MATHALQARAISLKCCPQWTEQDSINDLSPDDQINFAMQLILLPPRLPRGHKEDWQK